MLRPLLAFLFLSLTTLPAQLVTETAGGTTTAPSGANRGKGSLFRVDTSVLLLDFAMQLNVTVPDTLTFFMFRHHSRTGVATLEWTHQVPVAGGGGPQWYSTGPVALNLVAGNYYVLGAYWTSTVTYYYSTSASPQMSWGVWQRAHTFTGSIPPTVTLTGSDIANYYMQFQSIVVPAVVNTGTGCSAVAPVPRMVADNFFSVGALSSIEICDAAAGSIALFGFAPNGALPFGIPLFNCLLWLDISQPVLTFASLTTSGFASLPIAVPADPGLFGQTYSLQGLLFGATTIDMTNAVSFTIQ
ncbi:MAG TPA: hypothetical protein VF384_08215 [Planctomycetota bacterium]